MVKDAAQYDTSIDSFLGDDMANPMIEVDEYVVVVAVASQW